MSMKLMNYDNYQNGYGSYKIPSADVSSLDKTDGNAKKDSVSAAQPVAKENIPLTSDNINKASKTASLDSVSVTFNKNESFGYIGSDKDISKLDETRSVSGKQKDSLLNDYP
jgi:hypothetical protein